MDNPVNLLEQRCAALGVKPVMAVRRAGLSEATWFRWKAETSSPTFKKIRAVNEALDTIAAERVSPAA